MAINDYQNCLLFKCSFIPSLESQTWWSNCSRKIPDDVYSILDLHGLFWFLFIFCFDFFIAQRHRLHHARGIYRSQRSVFWRKSRNCEHRWPSATWAMDSKRYRWNHCIWRRSISDKDPISPQHSPIYGWTDRVNLSWRNWSKDNPNPCSMFEFNFN